MKCKFKKITILFFICILIHVYTFANPLNLVLTSDKNEIKQGDEITIKVSWNEGMQAADFSLIYDSNKVEYIRSDIEDDYINTTERGNLKTAWISLNDVDKTEITYYFKAKKSGECNFSTKINGGFANGNLISPDSYNEADLQIRIDTNIINILLKCSFLIIFLFILFVVIKKTIKKK